MLGAKYSIKVFLKLIIQNDILFQVTGVFGVVAGIGRVTCETKSHMFESLEARVHISGENHVIGIKNILLFFWPFLFSEND